MTALLAFIHAHVDVLMPLYVVLWSVVFAQLARLAAGWPRVAAVLHALALSPAPRTRAAAIAAAVQAAEEDTKP